MILICLGMPQISPDQMMSQAAQDYQLLGFGTIFGGFIQPESLFPSWSIGPVRHPPSGRPKA